MAFRTDDKNQLVAFKGHECSKVTIDGIAYEFSEHPLETVVSNKTANSYEILIEGYGSVSIPVNMNKKKTYSLYDARNKRVKYTRNGNYIQFEVSDKISGRLESG